MATSKKSAARTGKTAPPDAAELALVELLEKLDAHPGEPQHVPVLPSDIGGELLALLSKGLYTNPLDSIREYVQNSVDAGATKVTISHAGTSVQVSDDGAGMSIEAVMQARQFGLSGKSIHEHVGFRGIGIYSGFDLCQRLVITSLRLGDDHTNVLTFDFAEMRKQLERDRQKKSGESKTSLTELLSDHTAVTRQPSGLGEDAHFTTVDLQGLSDTHLRQLSNRKELRRYLLQNLPIDFDDAFPHAKKVKAYLKKHVPGYKAITVTLQAEGQPDENVAKYAEQDLHIPGESLTFHPPQLEVIRNSSKIIAVYWSCLNTERSRIQPRPRKNSKYFGYFDDRPDYEGLVYKVKGFTIGDRRKLQLTFTRKPQLYSWHTGEVYVVDNDVVPNAERDDFETNTARRALAVFVSKQMAALEKTAEDFQAESVAEERLVEYSAEVADIARSLDEEERRDDVRTYSRLDEIERDWQRQKRNIKDESTAASAELIKKIGKLRKEIERRTERESENARRSERARKGSNGKSSSPADDAGPTGSPDASDTDATPIRRSLVEVCEELGWDSETEVGAFAEMIQETLEAILDEDQYQLVVNDIAARLASAAESDEA